MFLATNRIHASLMIAALILTTITAASAEITPEDAFAQRADSSLLRVVTEQRIAAEMSTTTYAMSASDIESTIKQVQEGAAPAPPSDLYANSLNLMAAYKVLKAQNDSLSNGVAAQDTQVVACQVSNRIQQALSGGQALVNNNSPGQKNTIVIAQLIVPVIFFTCNSPQSNKPPKTQKAAAASNPAPTQTSAPALLLANGPTMSEASVYSINLAQEAANPNAGARTQALTASYYQLWAAARNESAINQSLAAVKDAGDQQVAQCHFLSNAETALAGANGLSGKPSIGTKNTLAITGLVLPIVFFGCNVSRASTTPTTK